MLPTGCLLAAGGGPAPLVAEIALCFVAAAVLALVCEKLRLPSIAGFVFAGLAIGPIGLGWVQDRSNIETIASLGLALLLFLIGLEIDVRSLLASGRTLIVTGLTQVPLCIGLGFGVFTLVKVTGLAVAQGDYAVLYLALGCAFSSTLLVVKTLHDRLQMDTVDGRLCIGLLIFQDIWAIVVLAVQPNLDDPQVGPLVATFLGIGLVLGIAVVFTRLVLPAAFRVVAKSPELVVTLALGWCFGLGMTAANLGPWAKALELPLEPALSLELGALVAGASIATFPYAHEVVTKVSNLRDFFITLFFVALGMSIPVPDGVGVLLAALVLVVVAGALRYLVFLPLLYGSGLDRRHATTTSTKLAQVSEFALVIAYLGLSLGHIDAELVSVVIFAFVLTAVLTPKLFSAADSLYLRIAPALRVVGIRDRAQAEQEPEDDSRPRIVLLGFHRLASSVLHDLERDHPELVADVLVVDLNVALHPKIRARGVRVAYGDFSNPAALMHTGALGADVIISTIGDDLLKGTTNLELTRQLRKLAPKARLVVNTVKLRDVPAMYDAGADYVFSWATETSHGVVPAVYAALNGDIRGFLETRRYEAGEQLVQRDEVLN